MLSTAITAALSGYNYSYNTFIFKVKELHNCDYL